MEPFWNEVRIDQIIGRAIRQCSHKDLPMEERKVDVYRYKMVRENEKETTDEKMEDISRKKNNLIQSFLEAVRESAVDCELFKAHNMMGMKPRPPQYLFLEYVLSLSKRTPLPVPNVNRTFQKFKFTSKYINEFPLLYLFPIELPKNK